MDRNHDIVAELGWRTRAQSAARTTDTPEWLAPARPDPEDCARAGVWRAAAEQLETYRDRYQIEDDGLGERPRDLAQLRDWRDCQRIMDRLTDRTSARTVQRSRRRDTGVQID